MDILSNALPASKSYATRGYHFLRTFAGAALGTLTVTMGASTKNVASYSLTEHAGVPAPARGFRLAKIAGGTDREALNYDVLIDPTGHDGCECRGFSGPPLRLPPQGGESSASASACSRDTRAFDSLIAQAASRRLRASVHVISQP